MKALFLDRDGVVNKDTGYVTKWNEFKFMPGIFDVCRAFQAKEYLIIVLTNQSAVARGMCTTKDVHRLHTLMKDRFQEEGVNVANVYHCPHHPSYSICRCRKPGTGMIDEALLDFPDINLEKSVMIGDKDSDIRMAVTAGIGTSIRIRSQYDSIWSERMATYVVDKLEDIPTTDIFREITA